MSATNGTGAAVCPECGEAVRNRPPSTWNRTWGRRPSWSHLDGEPLCPVIGRSGGYEPAQPKHGRKGGKR